MSEYKLLDTIHSPEDIKKLPADRLDRLCGELRKFLLETVSKTGGHLSSNLGIVEITVALHRVYDTSRDRILFDVGHQCYVHKILTGRRSGMDSIRSLGGLSGFPRPSESSHDAFIAGHASTSVSAAVGIARAEKLKNSDVGTVALIGDGALTGGLAYEALNDAGASELPLVVVLNDNGMSIAKNVGGLSRYLAKFRIRKNYIRAKETYHKILRFVPFGRSVNKFLTGIKDAVRGSFIPGTFFENMGFRYIGPIDGHDIRMLIYSLQLARELQKPVLVHTVTTKGKGYSLSEQNPDDYHGVSGFDTNRGVFRSGECFSAVFGRTMCALAEKLPNLCAVTAAMPAGTGLNQFRLKYPERFFDVGIAEEHAVTMAAGMAKQGMRPVCAVYSTFLQRSYDQILHDVSILSLPVVFAVDRAGLVGEDGETHHGVFDIAYLGSVPGMCIHLPASYAELQSMLSYALCQPGPQAVRYPRGTEQSYKEDRSGEKESVLQHGSEVTVVSCGLLINEAIAAVERLRISGISAELVKLNRYDGTNYDRVLESLKKTGRLVVAEDCVDSGCLGRFISSSAALCGVLLSHTKLLNLGSSFAPGGAKDELYRMYSLTSDGIAACAAEAVGRRLSAANG